MNTETFYVDIELQSGEAFDLSGLAVLSQEFFGDRQVIRIGYSMLSFLDGSYEIYRFVNRYREQVLCVESYRHDITALTRTFPSFLSGMVGLWRERLEYFYGYCGRLLIRADENFTEVCREPLGHFLRRELPVETSLETYKKVLSRSSDYRALVAAAEEAGYRNIETILIPQGGNVYKLGLQLARNTRNRLIFTASDLITFDLIRAFNDTGLQPSRDYHIVGFDNIEGINIRPCPVPMATAIYYNREKAAIIAAQLLLSEIRQPSGYTHIIKIPTEFILRESGLNRKYNSFAETISIQNHSKKGTRT